MHSDSDLQDDIFNPATTIERTSKFHPKACIFKKNILTKPSKSSASEGPSSTSEFTLEFPSSSLSPPTHHIEQRTDCSESLDDYAKSSMASDADTIHYDCASHDDIFAPPTTAEGMKNKFQPKPCTKNAKQEQLSSSTLTSSTIKESDFEVFDFQKSASYLDSNFINYETSHVDKEKFGKASDQFASVEMSEIDTEKMSTTGAANVETSYLSERAANLPTDSVEIMKESTTIHSSVEPLDDLFMQSDPLNVKQIGKFRPKPALRVNQKKKIKSVSFVLPDNDDELPSSHESQSNMDTSNPIGKITSFVEMMSSQNMNDSFDSLSSGNPHDQVDFMGIVGENVMDVSAFDTFDILSEPVCNSDELVEKFQLDLHARTKSATENADYSQLDSVPMHNESLDANGFTAPAENPTESSEITPPNCFRTNSSEEMPFLGNFNGLEGQPCCENEDLSTMNGDDPIEHIEDPNLEECIPSSVRNDETKKSSWKARLRNKSKSSEANNMDDKYHNAESTFSDMNDDYSGDGHKDDDDNDTHKKKRRKAPQKSSSRCSEHEDSVKRRKKDSEEPCSKVKDPPKKRLPHGSTRCKRANRQVDKGLLGIPDDELDRRQLAIKDLIRLAGYKERISSKEAASLKNSFSKRSEEHERNPNDEDDDENGDVQQAAPRLNYHSYLRRPLKTRWSKTDTESFYQAIRQFGTDFEMVQVLFPDRSRQQVKAKFKNEQRKHPLQIADALDHRSKDHSHFERVIQHLQTIAEQNAKNDADNPVVESSDEADQNEEDRTEEVNSKDDGTEFSFKTNKWDVDAHFSPKFSGFDNDFDLQSEDFSEKEKFWR